MLKTHSVFSHNSVSLLTVEHMEYRQAIAVNKILFDI